MFQYRYQLLNNAVICVNIRFKCNLYLTKQVIKKRFLIYSDGLAKGQNLLRKGGQGTTRQWTSKCLKSVLTKGRLETVTYE